MMSESFDIIIIGAGPAGMAAAQLVAGKGAKTLILDEQSSPGGQIFRAIEANQHRERPELGEAYSDGLSLTQAFRNSDVQYVANASVWQLSKDLELAYSSQGAARQATAKHIIVATGAQERPMPIPGWTLPGVMTIGAAQILLKESQIGIKDAVFVGSGPLFYLVLWQYLQAGISIKAAIDLTPKENYRRAISKLPGALPGVGKLIEGWRWKREIAKSGITFIQQVNDVRITGEDKVSGIDYLQHGNWKHLVSDEVLLHQGVVPNINISRAAGCDTRWNDDQACWVVEVDEWYQSSIAGISVTGDGASIGGGVAAELGGRLAALNALVQIKKLSKEQLNQLAKPYRSALKKELSVRPFLDALFRPAEQFRIPDQDQTVVCRCEEITVAEIRAAVNTGCVGPNQLKSYSRCGMGPCQGRLCGLTVSELIAGILDKPVEEIGYYRIRPPIKPLLLSELANLHQDPAGKADA